MYGPEAEDFIYYLTLYNENYPMPALPVPEATPRHGSRDRSRAGSCAASTAMSAQRGSGPDGGGRLGRQPVGHDPVLRHGLAGGDARPASCSPPSGTWPPSAWSVTSYKALREDGLEVERWNRLHPAAHAGCPT